MRAGNQIHVRDLTPGDIAILPSWKQTVLILATEAIADDPDRVMLTVMHIEAKFVTARDTTITERRPFFYDMAATLLARGATVPLKRYRVTITFDIEAPDIETAYDVARGRVEADEELPAMIADLETGQSRPVTL